MTGWKHARLAVTVVSLGLMGCAARGESGPIFGGSSDSNKVCHDDGSCTYTDWSCEPGLEYSCTGANDCSGTGTCQGDTHTLSACICAPPPPPASF
ncbi:MAG: hypothetical protein KC417_12260, partial [Myxococcales bacterium]|nr:hypothetical protein [Myxococcales bacterium]